MAGEPDYRSERFAMPLSLSSLGRSIKGMPLAPVLSILFGGVAAILVLATPNWMFDRMIMASGLPVLAPFVSPPFGDAARILAAVSAFWLVAGMLWPIFALIGALLTPKPRKGKGHRIEASLDDAVPPLHFEALIRNPGSGPAVAPGAANDPADEATGTSASLPPEQGVASDAVANRTIWPHRYKARKGKPDLPNPSDAGGKAVNAPETRR